MDTLNGVQRTDDLLRDVEDVARELLRGITRNKSADRLKGFVDGRIVGCIETLSSSDMTSGDGDRVL